MSKEVDIKDLATEIAAGLTEYDQNVADEIKTIVDDVAQEGVDELKQSSPKLPVLPGALLCRRYSNGDGSGCW